MKKTKQSAFTLIELLVATAVTAIIVGLMISMVSNLLTAYNRSSGALSAQSQANFVLDQLSTEIQSMVVRNTNSDIMFELNFPGGALGNKPSGGSLALYTGNEFAPGPIAADRFGLSGMQLRFFTAAAGLTDDPNRGVRMVGYRLIHQPVAGDSGPEQYMLLREEVSAARTFSPDRGYNLDDYPEGTTIQSRPIDLSEPRYEVRDIIAGNVVDFGVRVFTFNDNRMRELIYPFAAGSYEAPINDPYPRAVEVMIRILTPEGERLLQAFDQIVDADWWQIVEQHSEVFTRVINIPSHPL